MQAKDILVCLVCILLELQIGLAVDVEEYFQLFRTAAIITSTHGLKITAEANQLIELSCRSQCGLLKWEVNLHSISAQSQQYSVPEVEHYSVERLCGINGTQQCSNQNTFLRCEDASEEQYLVSHLHVRPRDDDLVVQCVGQLSIGSNAYIKYSRAMTIRINRTEPELKPTSAATISPSSAISHLPSSSAASISCSSSPSRQTISTPSQQDTNFMTLCFVNKPEFTFGIIGVSGGLLVLTVIGWILVLLLCCKKRNDKSAQKDQFSQYWNALSSKESTLDRIQPHQSSTGGSQETNLYSSIMPQTSIISHYEHSPQLPSRSQNSNTVV